MSMLIRKRLALASLVVLFALLGLVWAPVMAQDDAEGQQSAEDAEDSSLERLTVVGSRIKRSEVEGPAPVTVITREDIDRDGFQTVGDMLQTLSQNTASSFTGDLGVSGFTPNAQVVNLRNLGPGYTLTLVNGRRPAQYPQPYNRDNNVVNVKSIPTSIVERIEVLTGGASAIYGSDAVAGVVNIVLRENYDGNLLRGTIGATHDGGGESVDLEYAGGRMGQGWSTTFALQYGENKPVFGSQRKFMVDIRDNPWGLVVNPSLSLVAISAAGIAGPGGHNILELDPETCAAFDYEPAESDARGEWCGSYTQNGSQSIWNKNRFYSGYFNGQLELDNNLELFGNVSYYSSDSKSSSGTEFWGTSGNRATPAAVFFDPNFGDLLQLQRVFNPFELGGNEAASTLYDESTWDITGGVRGTWGHRFDWELYGSYSRYDYEADRPRLLAKAVSEYFIGEQQGEFSGFPVFELDVDRFTTPITPEIYNSFATRVLNTAKTDSTTAAFNVSGDLFDLPAGPVGFAGVLEGVRQTTLLESDPRTDPLRDYDEHTVYNLVSSGRTDGKRDRFAVGAEFRVPLLESLTANLAVRYDKYDDITAIDDAVTTNAGLEWRPVDRLLVRGGYATSFRAPDMQLVYAEGAASYSSILDTYACRSGIGLGQEVDDDGNPIPRTKADCDVSGDPTIYQTQSVIAGNPDLKEEEGTSYSLGFVLDVMDGMSLSVDYWRIKLDDAASQLSAGYLLDTEAACRLGGHENPDRPMPSQELCDNVMGLITRREAPGTTLDGQVDRINTAYINTSRQDISGVDVNINYRFVTDRFGTFSFDVDYSNVLTNKYQEFEEDELIDYRNEAPQYFYPERSRARWSARWDRNTWGGTLYATRLGSAWGAQERDDCFSGDNEHVCFKRKLSSFTTWNGQVTKRFSDSIRGEFTVVNLFDKKYRNDPGESAYPYFNPWIGADPLGRRYYMSVSYSF